MADKGFNGTTMTFNGTIAKIRSITDTSKAPAVNVAGIDDTTELYEVGKTDPELTVEVVGSHSLTIGTKGAIVVTWNDGTSTSYGNAVLTDITKKGSKNGEITNDAKFKPTPA